MSKIENYSGAIVDVVNKAFDLEPNERMILTALGVVGVAVVKGAGDVAYLTVLGILLIRAAIATRPRERAIEDPSGPATDGSP